MTPERWQHLKALLHSALERKPHERAAFLAEAWGDDEALREDLQSLLVHEEQASSFIEQPAFGVMAETLTNKAATTMLGRTLGRYRIISALGSGGMGEVYVAEDTQLGRKIALKTLPAHFTMDDERVRRFQQEARAASALNHPNIITIYEIGQIDSRHFIVTEFIEGETLRQHMAKTQMVISEALDVAAQMASALATAHQAGIVHRDIKPENIMLRADGIAKVLDFGLVKLTERKNVTSDPAPLFETAPGMVMGTAHYMSPEQARGLPVDARTDIWSLGIVLFEMVGGRVPFEGATSSDVIASILDREPTTLARYSPEAPAELEWIVKKALRKDREERYQTAKELLSDLKGLKRRLEFEQELERSTDSWQRSSAVDRGSGDVSAEAARAGSQSQGQPAREVIDSLAILPLVNNCPDPNMEYLSDGITESMISALSKLTQLRVMAWSTVSRYKDHQVGPREAGRELSVRAVLTGRVMQLGDNLVIKTELVDATDGSHLWGEQYSCMPSDILDVEAEISRAISEKLLVRLTTEERKQLTKRHTETTAAYHLYLKGRYYWNKRSEEALHKGIECFQQAIEIDPNYALAYAGVADCYTKLGDVGVTAMLPREAFTRARSAALTALEIDNSLAEVHASLGHLDMHQLRWADAERDFKRAIELNPNYPTAHQWYAYYLAFHHRLDEALEKIDVALELDPLSLPIADSVGEFLYFARRYDEAIAQFRKTLEMEPNFLASRIHLGRAYEQSAMFSEAEDQFVKARQIAGESIDALAALGHTYAMSGSTGAALEVLAQLTELSKERYVSPYDIALIHTALGETDEAFRLLEKAYDERVEWVLYTNVDPRLDPLRSDARFLDLMRRIGFAPTNSFHRGTISSEKERIEKTKEQAARPKRFPRHISIVLLFAVIALIATAFYFSRPRAGLSDPLSQPIRSIAVLPLKNLTNDPANEYFSDGMTDSLITALSKVDGLTVISRGSVFRFKGQEVDPREVGKRLNVAAVLEGSVRKDGESVRVAVRLVSVEDGRVLWTSEMYNRALRDIFALQDDIARSVAAGLKVELSGDGEQRLARRYTDNVEAYQFYLKGRYYWNKRTEEGLKQGIEYFEQAIAKDPRYAQAYAGLADSYILMGVGDYGVLPPKQAMPKAKDAALKALAIDETLAEAHTSLGFLNYVFDWDWPGAESHFRRAIELNPNYVTAHHWYGLYLAVMGRFDEGINQTHRALELDPSSPIINTDLGLIFCYARQPDRAIEQLKKTLEREPNFVVARWRLARAYAQKAMYQEATAEIQKAIEVAGRRPFYLSLMGYVDALAGKRTEALKILKELKELPQRQENSPALIATVYVGLDDRDQAFEWLDKAYKERFTALIALKVEPMFDNLRSDPRFQDLQRRVGLAP